MKITNAQEKQFIKFIALVMAWLIISISVPHFSLWNINLGAGVAEAGLGDPCNDANVPQIGGSCTRIDNTRINTGFFKRWACDNDPQKEIQCSDNNLRINNCQTCFSQSNRQWCWKESPASGYCAATGPASGSARQTCLTQSDAAGYNYNTAGDAAACASVPAAAGGPCGASGQACCPSIVRTNPCDSGLTCQSGTCQSAGVDDFTVTPIVPTSGDPTITLIADWSNTNLRGNRLLDVDIHYDVRKPDNTNLYTFTIYLGNINLCDATAKTCTIRTERLTQAGTYSYTVTMGRSVNLPLPQKTGTVEFSAATVGCVTDNICGAGESATCPDCSVTPSSSGCCIYGDIPPGGSIHYERETYNECYFRTDKIGFSAARSCRNAANYICNKGCIEAGYTEGGGCDGRGTKSEDIASIDTNLCRGEGECACLGESTGVTPPPGTTTNNCTQAAQRRADLLNRRLISAVCIPGTLPYNIESCGRGTSYCSRSDETCACLFDTQVVSTFYGAFTRPDTGPSLAPLPEAAGEWRPPGEVNEDTLRIKDPDSSRKCDDNYVSAVRLTTSIGSTGIGTGTTKLFQAGSSIDVVGDVKKLSKTYDGYNFTCQEWRPWKCKVEDCSTVLGIDLGLCTKIKFRDCPSGSNNLHEEGNTRPRWDVLQAIVDLVAVAIIVIGAFTGCVQCITEGIAMLVNSIESGPENCRPLGQTIVSSARAGTASCRGPNANCVGGIHVSQYQAIGSVMVQAAACLEKQWLEDSECFRICGRQTNTRIGPGPPTITCNPGPSPGTGTSTGRANIGAADVDYNASEALCSPPGWAERIVNIEFRGPTGETLLSDSATTDSAGRFSYTYTAPAVDGEINVIATTARP